MSSYFLQNIYISYPTGRLSYVSALENERGSIVHAKKQGKTA